MFANNDDNESETAKPIKMIVVGDRKTLLVNIHMTNRLVHIVIMVTNGLSITSHNTLISRIQYCESHVMFSDSRRLYRFDAARLLFCRTMFCPLSWYSMMWSNIRWHSIFPMKTFSVSVSTICTFWIASSQHQFEATVRRFNLPIDVNDTVHRALDTIC